MCRWCDYTCKRAVWSQPPEKLGNGKYQKFAIFCSVNRRIISWQCRCSIVHHNSFYALCWWMVAIISSTNVCTHDSSSGCQLSCDHMMTVGHQLSIPCKITWVGIPAGTPNLQPLGSSVPIPRYGKWVSFHKEISAKSPCRSPSAVGTVIVKAEGWVNVQTACWNMKSHTKFDSLVNLILNIAPGQVHISQWIHVSK